jgi:hypothetical protein
VRMKGVDLSDLIEAIAEVIDQYMKDHPDFTADEAAAAVSFVHGAIFRQASDIPANKLH